MDGELQDVLLAAADDGDSSQLACDRSLVSSRAMFFAVDCEQDAAGHTFVEFLQHGGDDHAELGEQFLGCGRHFGRFGHCFMVQD